MAGNCDANIGSHALLQKARNTNIVDASLHTSLIIHTGVIILMAWSDNQVLLSTFAEIPPMLQ
eukprot:3895655-Amphidinium_carterae.1